MPMGLCGAMPNIFYYTGRRDHACRYSRGAPYIYIYIIVGSRPKVRPLDLTTPHPFLLSRGQDKRTRGDPINIIYIKGSRL